MFNSGVLDVAVGLIFVYLLLGLMCTTVNEWCAQLFKTRAATLKEGIHQLLHAPPDGTYLIRPQDINVTALAKRFNNAGDKLRQAVGTFGGDLQSGLSQFQTALTADANAQPPVSLTAAMAEQLNAALKQRELYKKIDDGKVRPETKAEITEQLTEDGLLRVNRAILGEAYPDEITSLTDAFYRHPLIKSLARPGKHPSYVPANTFALTLLDILGKGQAVIGTGEREVAQIKAAIDNLPDSDTKKSLQTLLLHGSESVEKVQEKIEGWYNDAMDRVSGWYKSRVQVWTVVIASLITILVNADTIQIAQKLMINPVLREKIVEQAKAQNGSDQTQTAGTLTAQQKEDLSSLTGWADEFRTFHHLEAGGDPSLTKTALAWLWAVVAAHLVGWILTAIAASLGAPFWFDTLNRFMNVRAAGTSPNEKGSDKSKS